MLLAEREKQRVRESDLAAKYEAKFKELQEQRLQLSQTKKSVAEARIADAQEISRLQADLDRREALLSRKEQEARAAKVQQAQASQDVSLRPPRPKHQRPIIVDDAGSSDDEADDGDDVPLAMRGQESNEERRLRKHLAELEKQHQQLLRRLDLGM